MRPLNKFYPLNNDLKFNLRCITGISLGLFLYLIFFLPLDPLTPDFSKKILILAGFAIIIMAFLVIFRILAPSLFPRLFDPERWTIKNEVVLHLLFLVLNSVGFVFFAQYVARIQITFHLTVNIIMISMAPIVIQIIINQYDYLKKRLQELLKQDEIPESKEMESGIEFELGSQSEHFFLFPEQIILIKAANNYIEIIYKQNEKVHHRLIRKTLEKTEKAISKYPFIIRCHRSFLVNKNYISEIRKSPTGLKLVLFDYPYRINVSSQYALKIKEILKENS